jgi:hypothetical protein
VRTGTENAPRCHLLSHAALQAGFIFDPTKHHVEDSSISKVGVGGGREGRGSRTRSESTSKRWRRDAIPKVRSNFVFLGQALCVPVDSRAPLRPGSFIVRAPPRYLLMCERLAENRWTAAAKACWDAQKKVRWISCAPRLIAHTLTVSGATSTTCGRCKGGICILFCEGHHRSQPSRVRTNGHVCQEEHPQGHLHREFNHRLQPNAGLESRK